MIITKNETLESKYLDVTGMELLPVEILADYRENGASGVVDLGTFSVEETAELNEYGIAAANAIGDGWNNPALLELPDKGACSCCIKTLDDGTVVMGRNMDLPIGYAPVTIFRTKGDGKTTFDTVNIGYGSPGLMTFDQIAEIGGIPKEVFATMAICTTDTYNSEGLLLEVNMREGSDCPTSSTNPDGVFRTCVLSLCRVMGTCCATIEDALSYIDTIDVYDPRCTLLNWSMAVAMMDKTGRYGVLEFANNKIIWNEGRPGFACGQCNFYWCHESGTHRFGAGIGRWQKLMEHYSYINKPEDMEKAMEAIWYSNLFTDGSLAKEWRVNWLSEMNDPTQNYASSTLLQTVLGWKEQYDISVDEEEYARVSALFERAEDEEPLMWDIDYLNNPANFYEVIAMTDLYIKSFVQLPHDVQKASGLMEASTISYIATNDKPGFRLRLFEMNDVYHVGLYETTIDRIPTTKIHGNLK